MNPYRLFHILVFALCLSGCATTPTPSPTTTPLPPTPTHAPTATNAQPPATLPPSATPIPPTVTVVPPVPTATPTLVDTGEADIEPITTLVAQMESAVQRRDQTTYLSYINRSDPLFTLEHTRWSDEWAARSIATAYEMAVDTITITGDTATATLRITWSTATMDERTADLPVWFRRDGEGEWKYAGEQWVMYETDHFVVLVAPGQEAFAEEILPSLPAIYDHATQSLDHTPSTRNTIKLYDSSADLVAMTLLSLSDITGWNEPGESLKLFNREGRIPQAIIAHEFTHFLTFDMANTTHGKSPWWLMEGLAQYVAAEFWADGEAEAYLELVVEWNAEDNLIPWAAISDFNNIQTNRWRDTYPQGYSFVRYVTETYGVAARNEWLRRMSATDTIETATPAAFGVTFEQADTAWREWLTK